MPIGGKGLSPMRPPTCMDGGGRMNSPTQTPSPRLPGRKNEHAGHHISNYPSGKYCQTCKREVLARELAV